jgi:hypothetical protein
MDKEKAIMETRVITAYRRSARLLAGEVVGSIEPCPPATEPDGMPTVNFLLAAAIALLFIGVASSAWAAIPQGVGAGCWVSGLTMADGGIAPNTSNNLSIYEREACEDGTSSAGGVSFGGPVVFSQGASALSEAQLGAGHLAAYARASGTSSPEIGGGTQNIYNAVGLAIGIAYFHDELTIQGTPNQDGFIMLQFSVDLDGDVEHSAGPNQAHIRANFRIDDHENHPDESIVFLDGAGFESNTIGFRPGTHLQIYGSVSAAATAQAGRGGNVCNPTFCVPGPFYPEASAMADARDGYFYIDVVTPGGSYSSESGHNYETPDGVNVPEPATWLMLAGGLLGLATLRGCARRRASLGLPAPHGTAHATPPNITRPSDFLPRSCRAG